jgi:hypothetical protein
MAENIAFSITIGGVDREIKTMQDLKRAIKDANNELLQAGEVGTKSYADAQKKVTDLKDRLGDLGDAAKVQGTTVEKLGASTGLLSQGFKSLDLDKIKIGFQGIGTAIKANPLMFLIGIIIPLLEKFKVFEILIGAIGKAFDWLTDAIGLTNKADEEASKTFIENKEKEKQALENRYDAEITLAKAAGKDVYKLEQEKRDALINATTAQILNLELLYQKKKEFNDEEKKNYEDLQTKLLKLNTERTAAEIKNERDKENEWQKIQNDKLKFSSDISKGLMSNSEKEVANLKENQAQRRDQLKKLYEDRIDSEGQYIEWQNKQKEIQKLENKEYNELIYNQNKSQIDATKNANEQLIQKIKELKNKDYLESIEDERKKALETLRIQNDAQIEDINKTKASKKLKNEALAQLDIDYKLQQEKINKQFDDKDKEAQLKNLIESNNLKISEAKNNYEKIKELKINSLEAERALSLSKGIDNEREYNSALLQINKEYEDAKLAQQTKANQDALNEEANFNELRILQTQEGTQARLDAEIEAIQFKLFRETQLTEKSEGEKLLIKKRAEQSIDKLRDEFAKKERERRFKETQDNLATSALVNKGLTDLSTVFYNTKLNNAKKGSAEEEKILKEQFEVNKAFQIANAVINGAMAVTSILASPANKVDPSGTVMAIQIAAAIASTAAQISTIERTRFQGGSPQAPEAPNMGGAGGQAPTGTPQMPQTRTEQGTFLNEQGQTTGRLDTRVYVLESDITNTQRDVNRVKTQSKV